MDNTREKLIKLLKECFDNGLNFEESADHLIANNVRTVVLCKNCIGKSHWYKNDNGCTICGFSGLFVADDRGFCSYGERRTYNGKT